MLALIGSILAQAEEHGEEVSEAKDLYPALGELIIGLVAFAVLFFFTWKWVLPRVRQVLEERRAAIQGEMERAEAHPRAGRPDARGVPGPGRRRREEANRIIEEARTTADQVRRDLQAKAEEESQATVGARGGDPRRAGSGVPGAPRQVGFDLRRARRSGRGGVDRRGALTSG